MHFLKNSISRVLCFTWWCHALSVPICVSNHMQAETKVPPFGFSVACSLRGHMTTRCVSFPHGQTDMQGVPGSVLLWQCREQWTLTHVPGCAHISASWVCVELRRQGQTFSVRTARAVTTRTRQALVSGLDANGLFCRNATGKYYGYIHTTHD